MLHIFPSRECVAKAFHGERVPMTWPPAKRSFDRPFRAPRQPWLRAVITATST